MVEFRVVSKSSTEVIVRAQSPVTGDMNEMTMPTTEARILDWMRNGTMIQDALPELSPDQREFLLTGFTPEDWDKTFPPGCEDPSDLDPEEEEDAF
jgi:hypothetical protein